MAIYRRTSDGWVDRDGNRMAVPDRGGLCAPQIIKPMPEYASPIDGRPITTRHERREDLKRNNCVEYEPTMIKNREPVLKNKRFAAKHGFATGEKLVRA